MAHARLQAALWRDTAFLASLGVMDYSLLVGVDRKNHVLVAGIIDFVRQVGWGGAYCGHAFCCEVVVDCQEMHPPLLRCLLTGMNAAQALQSAARLAQVFPCFILSSTASSVNVTTQPQHAAAYSTPGTSS